ncbi:hypothetical protein ERD78_17435 [Allopusillimonas soli]|uniref:Uncharacterized protein n=1 Tax=Allopusillimonas soli TaxID=659016 RepID=A0A853FF92_9BURK|nr:hypothetical protein [Allopusillimonas soli]NYT38549.1 hypothetical protein [Allopusillimonas soli]TEA71736.1 hypothetical protein ERD78_17435 [Allopusillimonas soli]
MPDSKTINLNELVPGVRVKLADGAIVEVTENPQDGAWIIGRYLEHPNNPELVSSNEQPIFATDIEGLVQ